MDWKIFAAEKEHSKQLSNMTTKLEFSKPTMEDGKLKRPVVELHPCSFIWVFGQKTGLILLGPVNYKTMTVETYISRKLRNFVRVFIGKYKISAKIGLREKATRPLFEEQPSNKAQTWYIHTRGAIANFNSVHLTPYFPWISSKKHRTQPTSRTTGKPSFAIQINK